MNSDSPNTADIVERLTMMERDLLLGDCKGWGSWMFEVGGGLCAKGLGTKRNGSIYFDTPLAAEVIAALKDHRKAQA